MNEANRTQGRYRISVEEFFVGHSETNVHEITAPSIENAKARAIDFCFGHKTWGEPRVDRAEVLRSNGTPGEDALEAIHNSRDLMPGYFMRTVMQRLPDIGSGSVYDNNRYSGETSGIKKTYGEEVANDWCAKRLAEDLEGASWKETSHPDVMPGCRVFVTTDIPGGRNGLLNVRDLPDDTLFLAQDPKSTGNISIAAGGTPGTPEERTFLIIGKDTDQPDPENRKKNVVFTFHPGEPVRPSVISVDQIKDGTVLSKQQVLGLGFERAKVDRAADERIGHGLEEGKFSLEGYREGEEYPIPASLQMSMVRSDPTLVRFIQDPDEAVSELAEENMYMDLRSRGAIYFDDHTIVFAGDEKLAGVSEHEMELFGIGESVEKYVVKADMEGRFFVSGEYDGNTHLESEHMSEADVGKWLEQVIIERRGPEPMDMETVGALSEMKQGIHEFSDRMEITKDTAGHETPGDRD